MLLQYLPRRLVSAGEVLWHLDDPATEMYVIEKGTIRWVDGRAGW